MELRYSVARKPSCPEGSEEVKRCIRKLTDAKEALSGDDALSALRAIMGGEAASENFIVSSPCMPNRLYAFCRRHQGRLVDCWSPFELRAN